MMRAVRNYFVFLGRCARIAFVGDWRYYSWMGVLSVFCLFAVFYLKEPLLWNYLLGFALIAAGALFVFAPWQHLTR